MKTERIATFSDFVGELTVTYKRTEIPQVKINGSKAAADFIRPYFEDFIDDHEEVKIIHLSRSNGVVNIDHVSKGGDASTIVPNSVIARNALKIKTSAVIMVHNHPSGRLEFSKSDIDSSKKLKEGLKFLELDLLDSLVLTREGYLSMSDENLI